MYDYTPSNIAMLKASLTERRLTKYLNKTNGDEIQALHLYVWNGAVSAAFYGHLQAIEISLRNAIHLRLSETYSADWYRNPTLHLDNYHQEKIAEHIDKLKGNGKGENIKPDDIISGVTLGFWIRLFSRRYRMLWNTSLHKIFPEDNDISMGNIREKLEYIRELRNRIAHYEPIFERDLHRDCRDLIEITGWISPAHCQWIAAHSRLPHLLSRTPNDPAVLM